MARLLIFFAAVFLLTGVLAQVPIVGALFRIPFLGFWFTAILLSAVFAKLGTEAVDLRARRSLERSLGAVDTPHHKGKLGAMLLNQGKARKAVPLFEAAAVGDPESLEWRYRLGQARFEAGADPEWVLAPLDSLLEDDEEHGFGGPMFLSARVLRKAGRNEEALDRVQRFERNHGPSPDSAILRGQLLKALERRDEANVAFDEVENLVRTMRGRSSGQRGMSRVRAFFARHMG